MVYKGSSFSNPEKGYGNSHFSLFLHLQKQQTTYEGEELYKEAQKALLDAKPHKE